MADVVGVAQGFVQIVLRLADGFGHGLASGEVGGDGRGERAAGAVRVLRLDAPGAELVEIGAVEGDVGEAVRRRAVAGNLKEEADGSVLVAAGGDIVEKDAGDVVVDGSVNGNIFEEGDGAVVLGGTVRITGTVLPP
jgi:hypothetical protein